MYISFKNGHEITILKHDYSNDLVKQLVNGPSTQAIMEASLRYPYFTTPTLSSRMNVAYDYW